MNKPTEPRRPTLEDHAPFYTAYVDLVPDVEVLADLEAQLAELDTLLSPLPQDRGAHRYAPGKWSLREVVGHLIDAERVFSYRALHIAREPGGELPGMDQDAWAAASSADRRPLGELTEELLVTRRASLALFRGFDETEWTRTGRASDCGFAVRAFPWIIAGHTRHHLDVLRERYL